ncbi:hypothetical protein [Cytobacillus praedii]|uniref:hypothetical protein n=1 Tax=Cytobacillus praedii TaxID=1742358 RepID=UPI000A835919|nr:hypothetical protein [Cytobacillus praedii]
MTMEVYLKLRDSGKGLEDIRIEKCISEATAWTFELGYQCYLKNIALDDAALIIKSWQ